MTLAIDRRAALWGERTAVLDHGSGEQLSYDDLASLIDTTASRLAALGIDANDTLAVVSRNRVEVLALLFAARRLGAVFAPVPHRLTPATAEPAIRQVEPSLVVHETAQRDLVGGIEPDCLVSFEELDAVEGERYERVERNLEDPLWYLRTDELLQDDRRRGNIEEDSKLDREQVRQGTVERDARGGQTVVVPERQVEWNCISAVVAWGLSPKDFAPTLEPFSAADGLLRLTLPMLYVGGTIVIQRAADPEGTLALVDDGLATRLFGSATVLREFSEVEGFADADWSNVTWAASGDPLDSDVANDFRVQGVPVIRSYGRPEAGPNALFVPPELADGSPSHIIGLPFPDAEVRIVDVDSEPVDSGEVGDLQIGGRIVASGYLGREGGTFDSGWVTTGEQARRDPESGFAVIADEKEPADRSS